MLRTALLPAFVTMAFTFAACGPSDPTPDPDPNGDAPGETLMSALDRDLSPQVDETDQAQLSHDNRGFAFDVLHELPSDSGENVFFSPHSISIALAMTYAGASGATHEQMGELLRFYLDEEVLHPAFNALDLDLATRSDVEVDEDGGDPPILNVVNAIWGQRDYPFANDFLDTLAVNYGAGLRVMDFLTSPEESRQKINEWVEDQTNDRIEELLPENSIGPDTVLVLTNAIYFLAGWHAPFEESLTFEGSFTRPDGSEVTTALMRETYAESNSYYLGDETVAISIPYVGRELSLIALMPTDGDDLEAWEAGLDRDRFDQVVQNLQPGIGSLVFPKFEFNGEYDLKEIFEVMGWEDYAQLQRMLESGLNGLEISGIFHKSFIALDEEGTEAAAATAVVVVDTAAPEPNYDLAFDRPFYYAIYDHPTDTILFLGRVFDPTVEE